MQKLYSMNNDSRTAQHERSVSGRVHMPYEVKSQKSAFAQFLSVMLIATVLALGLTSLLLHSSMQNNAQSLARIDEMEQTLETTSEKSLASIESSKMENPILPEAEEITEEPKILEPSTLPILSHMSEPPQDNPSGQTSPDVSKNIRVRKL